MALQIHYSPHYQFAKVAYGVSVGYQPSSDDCYPHTVKLLDLLLPVLDSTNFHVPVGARPVPLVLGSVSETSQPERLLVSNRPRASRVIYDSYDERFYGSLTRNLNLFGSTLFGYSLSAPSFINENYGRHSTYSGSVMLEQTDISSNVVDYDFYGYSSKVTQLTDGLYHFATINSLSPFDVSISKQGNLGTGWRFNLLDLLDYLTGKEIVHLSVDESVLHRRVLSQLSYDLSYERLVISYHMDTTQVLGTEHIAWDSKIVIPLGNPGPSISHVIGQQYRSSDYSEECVFSYAITLAILDEGVDCGHSPMFERDDGHHYPSFPFFISVPPPVSPADTQTILLRFSSLRNNLFLESFRVAVESSWNDVVPSSVFSSVDAYKKAEGYLGTNVLQTLVKLPGIVDALPSLKEAIDVLSRLARRDFRLSTLREILSFLTSSHLKYAFEIRPFLDLLFKYIPQMISTMDSIGLSTGPIVAHGVFRFEATNVLGRERVNLVTRTKIVMDSSPHGLLSAVLQIDALGLLPKASNLWDLLPFTFLVNWFTGIGEAIRRAEYSLFLASIPAYYVHTYAITSPFTTGELDSLEMTSASPRPAGLRLYYRDKTYFSPVPRDSKFGFGIPTEIPHWGTLGSLLYQLILG